MVREACLPVSVVIPAYNRQNSIRRAVDSALAQTIVDFELIVVDDASTDDTLAVVEAVRDPRIRVLRHDTNRRAAAARNTGIRNARGTWVAFLDSDDEWMPDKLALQLAFHAKAGPEVLASCTGYHIVSGSTVFAKVPAFTTYRQIFMGCDLSPGSTLMVRRDVYDTVGLNDESFYRYEDWDWVLRYTRRYRMGVVSEPLAIVYPSGHPAAAPMAEASERLLKAHLPEARKMGRLFARKVAALRWFELCHLYLREGNLSEGVRYGLKGLGTWPLVRVGMYVHIVEAVTDLPLRDVLWRLAGRHRAGGG